MSISEIARLRIDTVFMSMSAILDDIAFHRSPDMAETKRAMFAGAAMRVLPAGHTTFERRALHSFAALTEFDLVIFDDRIAPAHLERMRSKGIDLLVAPVDRPKPAFR